MPLISWLLLFFTVWTASARAHLIDIHQVTLELESPSDEALLKRLLGSRPPREWRQRSECQDRPKQLECHLATLLKSTTAAQQLLHLARHDGLHLMLDQSKFQSAKKVVFDYKTYQNYVDYPTREQESLWSAEQIALVSDVVSKLPTALTRFEQMKNIYLIGGGFFLTRDRSLPSKRPNVVAVTQNPTFRNGLIHNEGFIALFPEPFYVFGNNKDSRETLIHELAHALDHQSAGVDGTELSRREEWWSISWEQNGHEWMPISRHLFVSNYAMTNPAEDFADSVMTFLVAPERLRLASPAKFKFIAELLRQPLR